MKNFKNVICGFILPILLLIVLPYIGFWLYNQNYIHNYIEQSIMNGKYMQEIFVRLVWGILIGIYMLWLNKSSTFMAICSTAVMIIILVCSVLLFMMEKILINNDMLTPKEFQKAVNVAIQLDTQKPVIDDNRGQYSMNLMIICLPELLEKQ